MKSKENLNKPKPKHKIKSS